MQHRRVGRTDLELSVVGLGTAQLQLLTRRQAVDTLKRGFALGVNWVHSAPDYGGVEPWIAQAIEESGRDVKVLAQGPGPLSLLEPFFENTCVTFRQKRLDMYGLGCIDDLERLGENVWGNGGMVDFLLRKKKDGRLGALFCTTHGTADYVVRLVRSGVFDAIMVAYNPVGFHLLTYNPPPEENRRFEHIPDFRSQLFPSAAEHGVSILAMKALGGGLLARGRAFPPHEWLAAPAPPLAAGDLIKYVLGEPGVCAVVAGVASAEEAEENARAGHAPVELSDERRQLIEQSAGRMRLTLCSRCGQCESTCSKSLPISFMFRDAYIWNYRTETFMADDRFNYFRLHPDDSLACATCVDRTCVCPQGLDIPIALTRVHTRVQKLVASGQHPGRLETLRARSTGGPHHVMLVSSEVPGRMAPRADGVARFMVENGGSELWFTPGGGRKRADGIVIAAKARGRLVGKAPLRQNVSPGQRVQLVVEFRAPRQSGSYDFSFHLMPSTGRSAATQTTDFHRCMLTIESRRDAEVIRRLARPAVRVGRRLLHRVRSARTASSAEPHVVPGPSYGARYVEHTIPTRLRAGMTGGYGLTLENTGSLVWRSHPPDGRSVETHVSIDDVLYSVLPLPRQEVARGEKVTLHFALQPPHGEGRHQLRVELVHRPDILFSYEGVPPLTLDIEVERAECTKSTRPSALALKYNPYYYHPTQSIQHSADGRSFPLFISRAKGCRVWDPEGREYIDYTMSWGATILGHADDRIQAAIRERLDSGPLPPFPDPIEMEVARLLVEDFPSAETVTFGKNGSDVCTVAARLARLTTGKRVILSCGFHGWQDFALDNFGFADSGIPTGPERVLYKFRFNDRNDFFRLYQQNKNDLAAVMIEPAGPFMAVETGMGGDADPAFLREIAEATHRAKALLIFDEIITGYRYRKGSVQRHTGVVPDLTCLGKALASGMPLSALVGASRIFHTHFAKTHYCPTFRGEVYSFAAAKAAIEIYRAEPVADHIWRYGEDLRAGIHVIAKDLGVAVECKGPPFRMGLHFPEADGAVAQLKRTLFMQELLKEGVITVTGVMLPSYSHDPVVLHRTLEAIGTALEVVATAERTSDYDRYIEIPLL